jgi:hypothetical protein
MYIRSEPTTTLADLAQRFDVPLQTVHASAGSYMQVHGDGSTLDVRPTEGDPREIRLNDEGWATLGALLHIPDSFANRLPGTTRVNLTNDLLARHVKPVAVRFADDGIKSMLDPGQIPFEPRYLVEVAQRVVGEKGPVIGTVHNLTAFGFDTVTETGVRELGDPQVGDITRAGLRFNQNLRQNLAPSVSKYTYRLVCTNGMEVVDDGLKLDARGTQSVEEVMAELEALAQRAFSEVESDIEHFYAMREEPVANPERTLNRMARDFGISDRLRNELRDGVPAIVEEGGGTNMFDLVNYVTNFANRENVPHGQRVALERFGGHAVHEHVERCRTCAARVN